MGFALRRVLESPRALLFWGSVLVFVALSKGYISVSDSQARYEVARQIWYEGTILLPEGSTVTAFVSEGGRGVPPYGLGQSLLMLPSVITADALSRLGAAGAIERFDHRAGQFLYMILFQPLISAFCVLAVFTLACRLGIERRVAVWAAIAFGFGTFWLYYTRTLIQNTEVTALCLASVWVYTGGEKTPRRVACAALLLGATFLYRPEFLIPVVLALGVLIVERWQSRALNPRYLASLLIPVFLCGCWVLVHNHARSGNALEIFPGSTGYLFENERDAGSAAQDVPLLADYPGQNLLAALFGLSKGFFWYSPVMFLGLLALWPGQGTWKRILTLAAIPVAGQLLFISSLNWVIYEGGWGPRYLVPLTPFLVLGAAVALEPALRRPGVRIALAVAVIAGCLTQVTISMEDHSRPATQVALAQEKLAARSATTELALWHRSLLLGRLRNLSLHPLDPPELVAAWNTPEVQSVAPTIRDEFWWWKLGGRVSPLAGTLLMVFGVLVGLVGTTLLVRAVARAPASGRA